MNGNNNYTTTQSSFKDILLYALLTIALIYSMARITHYSERMKTYNNHICVDVYGLDESCNSEGVK